MSKTVTAQFFAITKDNVRLSLQRLPVNASLQEELVTEFLRQLGDFVTDKEVVSFSPTYLPGNDELSVISPYQTPSFLDRAITAVDQIEDLKMPFTPSAPQVKGTVLAIPEGDDGKRRFLFQYFDRRRILKKEWTLIWRNGHFGRLQDPGVVVADHLDAVIEGNELRFRSFHLASQFLPLHDYFEEATVEGIREFASHRLFCDADVDDVVASANDLTRKRIGFVLKSGILDANESTPEAIQAAAKKFELDLRCKGKPGKRRIIFPSKPQELRLLLQLLAEGLYVGLMSGEPYLANSYRKLS